MRDIKFRIWDKDLEIMFTPEGDRPRFYLDLFGKIFSYDGKTRPMEVSKVILMQFTGLKDKYGKEIYENDLVKVEVDDEDNPIIMQVEWCENCNGFTFGTYNNKATPNFYGSFLNFEIIGNIYENTELLEG